MISLRSKVIKKILTLFFLHEKESFYANELARLINEDPANTHKKLLELKKEGILNDEFRGKERFFFLNKKYPFLKEYRRLILKGIGFEKILKDNLKNIKGIESVFIFGSYPKNKISAESDIDLLIIGEPDTVELQKTLVKIQKLIHREINSIQLTKKEFEKRKKQKEPLLEDIFSKKYIKII